MFVQIIATKSTFYDNLGKIHIIIDSVLLKAMHGIIKIHAQLEHNSS